MTFVEHNNREKANKFAEYVTGKHLREYLAKKSEAVLWWKYICLRRSGRVRTTRTVH